MKQACSDPVLSMHEFLRCDRMSSGFLIAQTCKIAKESGEATSNREGAIQHGQPFHTLYASVFVIRSHMIEESGIVIVNFLLDISFRGCHKNSRQ